MTPTIRICSSGRTYRGIRCTRISADEFGVAAARTSLFNAGEELAHEFFRLNSSDNDAWPALAYADWQDTCGTLHLWTQVVGKVKLALAPLSNHWWGIVLFVTARGLTTGAMPYRESRAADRFRFLRS